MTESKSTRIALWNAITAAESIGLSFYAPLVESSMVFTKMENNDFDLFDINPCDQSPYCKITIKQKDQ